MIGCVVSCSMLCACFNVYYKQQGDFVMIMKPWYTFSMTMCSTSLVGVSDIRGMAIAIIGLGLSSIAIGAIQVLRNARGGGWVYAQALRSVTRGGGGLRQRYVTSFFLANCLVYRHVRRGFLNNLASISNNMFLCIMLTPKTCSTLIIIRNSYNPAV